MDWTTTEPLFVFPQREDMCFLSKMPRPALFQWVLQNLPPEIKQHICKTDYLRHLMPRLRVNGATPPLQHMPSWRGQGELHFYLLCKVATSILEVYLTQLNASMVGTKWINHVGRVIGVKIPTLFWSLSLKYEDTAEVVGKDVRKDLIFCVLRNQEEQEQGQKSSQRHDSKPALRNR